MTKISEMTDGGALQLTDQIEVSRPSSPDPLTRRVLPNASGVSFLQDGTGAASRSVQDRLRDTISVKDFGAVGDGVTDDTSAIQAALAAHKVVFFPPGDYRMNAVAPLQAGQSVVAHGDVTITWTGSGNYPGFLRANAVDDIYIAGIHFIGTGIQQDITDTGQSEPGAAIRGHNCRNVLIECCRFSNFYLGNVDQGVVAFSTTRDITVQGCTWDDDNTEGTGLLLQYRAHNSKVLRNNYFGNGDKFLFIATVPNSGEYIEVDSLIENTCFHDIAFNTIMLNGGKGKPIGRHGIAVHYQGGRTYAAITSNKIVGAHRHAIYLRGADSNELTGPSMVHNNYIRYCSGDSDAYTDNTVYHGVNCAIKCESTLGVQITNNTIEDTGYYPDGDVRPHPAAAIGYNRQARAVMISGNIIRRVNGSGLMIYATVSPQGVPNNAFAVTMSTNFIEDPVQEQAGFEGNPGAAFTHTPHCIRVGTSSATPDLYHIAIEGNTLVSSAANSKLLSYVTRTHDGALNPYCTVRNNSFIGSGAANGQWGIDGRPPIIEGNEFRDLAYGVGPGGYWAQRELGVTTRVRNNIARACGGLVLAQHTAAGRLSFVEPNNRYLDGTPLPSRTIGGWNLLMEGQVIGTDGTNELVELVLTAAPTQTEQYYRGDRVIYPAPSASGKIGAVCVASGTPGTWKEYGAVDA